MATFAVLNDGNVVNVIVADTKEIAEQVTNHTCVEYTEENPAGIGHVHDETTGTFSAPVAEDSNDPVK